MLVAGAYKGYQAKKLKEEEAQGYRDAAGRQMAITSREMQEEIRNKELMHSRAIAVAGISGAGTDGITKLLGDLNTESEYRVMSTLWNGQNEAEGLQYRAEAAEREGKAAQTAGIIDGITSSVSASSVQRETSKFLGRLDEVVASEILSVTDDSTLKDGAATSAFDREGLRPEVLPLIERGVLRNFLYDFSSMSYCKHQRFLG